MGRPRTVRPQLRRDSLGSTGMTHLRILVAYLIVVGLSCTRAPERSSPVQPQLADTQAFVDSLRRMVREQGDFVRRGFLTCPMPIVRGDSSSAPMPVVRTDSGALPYMPVARWGCQNPPPSRPNEHW